MQELQSAWLNNQWQHADDSVDPAYTHTHPYEREKRLILIVEISKETSKHRDAQTFTHGKKVNVSSSERVSPPWHFLIFPFIPADIGYKTVWCVWERERNSKECEDSQAACVSWPTIFIPIKRAYSRAAFLLNSRVLSFWSTASQCKSCGRQRRFGARARKRHVNYIYIYYYNRACARVRDSTRWRRRRRCCTARLNYCTENFDVKVVPGCARGRCYGSIRQAWTAILPVAHWTLLCASPLTPSRSLTLFAS